MKKMNESGLGTTTNLQAGNTSVTGNNVLDRTLKNQPANETLIRGIAIPYIRSCLGDDLVGRAIAAGIVRVV